jgi:microcin C transport system permease protein
MTLFQIDPLTRKRFQRFRRIKTGWYAFLTLMMMLVVSLLSNFIANNRAIIAKYDGKLYFPTYTYYDMETFGQEDEYGFTDGEADYRKLKADSKGTDNWVLMPVVPYNPYENDFAYDEPPPNAPDSRHWLGTDSQGRDVFARLLYGLRISLMFSFLLVISAQFIGTIIGSMQGFFGGGFDLFSQRFIEVWTTIPRFYAVIVIASLFTANFWTLLIILAAFYWIGITFYMRTEMYREKTKEYALAAQSFGASNWRLMFRHLLPNCITPLVTFTPFLVVTAIGSLTAFDFLGYGLPAPTASWGEMLEQATQADNRDKLWLILSPLSALTLTLTVVVFIGESIREAFDPKQYSKYQ